MKKKDTVLIVEKNFFHNFVIRINNIVMLVNAKMPEDDYLKRIGLKVLAF